MSAEICSKGVRVTYCGKTRELIYREGEVVSVCRSINGVCTSPPIDLGENPQHRSKSLINWFSTQHGIKLTAVITATEDGYSANTHPIHAAIGSQAKVIFNSWPYAWLLCECHVVEQHNNMKSLLRSITRHMSDDEPINSSTYYPDAVVFQSNPATTRARSADYSNFEGDPSLYPRLRMAGGLPNKITVWLYDGDRIISRDTARKMNISEDRELPDHSCEAFDVLHDICLERVRQLAINNRSFYLLAIELNFIFPANVMESIKVTDIGITRPGHYIKDMKNDPNGSHYIYHIDGWVLRVV